MLGLEPNCSNLPFPPVLGRGTFWEGVLMSKQQQLTEILVCSAIIPGVDPARSVGLFVDSKPPHRVLTRRKTIFQLPLKEVVHMPSVEVVDWFSPQLKDFVG